jgi:hypothetical protein
MKLPDKRQLLLPMDHPAVRVVVGLSLALALVSVMSYRSSQQIISHHRERRLLQTAAPSSVKLRDCNCGAQPSAAPKSLIALEARNDIPALLEAEGLKVGAELGVQVGAVGPGTVPGGRHPCMPPGPAAGSRCCPFRADNAEDCLLQLGVFAAHTLRRWKSCEKYYLIDLWAQQPNYFDGANVDNNEQEQRFQEAQERLRQWEGKTGAS